jgi:histidyl-tRNA synthetase
MTVRGTRNLIGADARDVLDAITRLRVLVEPRGFAPFIPSNLAYRELFQGQMGENRMYEFKDRSDRDLVLIPEVTAVARQEFRNNPNFPKQIWYATRCYRYDKPQRGRYREFWQFGVEDFGKHLASAKFAGIENIELLALAQKALEVFGLTNTDYTWKTGIDRGQGYYTGAGFEFRSNDGLQLLGGGPYKEGIGFALGIDRCILVGKEKYFMSVPDGTGNDHEL